MFYSSPPSGGTGKGNEMTNENENAVVEVATQTVQSNDTAVEAKAAQNAPENTDKQKNIKAKQPMSVVGRFWNLRLTAAVLQIFVTVVLLVCTIVFPSVSASETERPLRLCCWQRLWRLLFSTFSSWCRALRFAATEL